MTLAHRIQAFVRLREALRNLDADTSLKAALGNEFADAYIKLKTGEWNYFASHLTQWERDTTLDC